MTDRLALFLGLAIVAALAGDLLLFGADHLIFLGKKLAALIEWIAFWR